ncbi:2-hydroxyacid dehydrogenase [Psychromonas antarctica]|uniref:2-hydroxyacid dehydrogenase n=1 Tax=Psychromonas antarctica TaxID=67573 RepID=UPI001EE7D65E|nr:2-hydroxyacid dehydrogenase [Psychromonas antarctica]MCG6200108.1 2-hydroxyacid dehydrogenase [Psychromonas antarctica]
MKVAMFSTRSYDINHFNPLINSQVIQLKYFDTQLNIHTSQLAQGYDAVCAFVNDDLSAPVLTKLAELGIKALVMRCAGFNNVDISACKKLGITVMRVPAYSPEAVAEHAIALMMTLNRRIHKAYQRTRDANFSLHGLVGFNMSGKTVGIIGTGKIGLAAMRILKGFGCKLLAFDPYPSAQAIELGAEYVSAEQLFEQSDIITLHCPLTDDNHHLLKSQSFDKMKDGVMIINTSRGALLNATDAIGALKEGKIGALGLDVYEEEDSLFFGDHSDEIIGDDVFRRLSACHNVIFTGHQAFLTKEALTSIAQTTLDNLQSFTSGHPNGNEVS